jgi:hypothetical protein
VGEKQNQVAVTDTMLHFCRRHPGKKCMILIAIAAAAMASVWGCSRDPVSGLHAAEAPVRALSHHSDDPTAAFPESFPLQVAVYWSKPDEGLLGIVHALRAMGIPFFITRELDQALRHHLVIVYPSVDSHTFTAEQVRRLTHHVESGGSVFAVNVFSGALQPLFGFRGFAPSRRRYRVDFAAGADPSLKYLNRPQELEVQLGSPKYAEIFWTNGYLADASAKVLARFEDGSAAVLRKSSGKGNAYLMGLSFQDAVLRNQVNRDYDAERHYVNTFEPGADVWMLLLRAWYESREPDSVRLDTIPAGQSSVLLLSHDVDWENSFAPAREFARMEKRSHTLSTFFIQTKYVSDYNSRSFFFGKDLAHLKQLYAEGFSIGSHSVIHSRGFNRFALGSGNETFASYRPRGTGFDTASGANVFGEVRVSRQLLDGELPGQQTVFFRAGHLRVPATLPEALQRCGYEFDSSFTANDVLTNFPYALPLDLGFVEDSGLYEFPVTFEDEEPPSLAQRIEKTLGVIRANAENGAINVVLIHTNELSTKLPAEEELLRKLPGDVTPMDMTGFARFWRARDRLRWSVAPWRHAAGVQLSITADEPVDGLTFYFQREIADLEGGAAILPDHHRIVLRALHAGEQISLHIRYQPVRPLERLSSSFARKK